jgi:hypothetical protein
MYVPYGLALILHYIVTLDAHASAGPCRYRQSSKRDSAWSVELERRLEASGSVARWLRKLLRQAVVSKVWEETLD